MDSASPLSRTRKFLSGGTGPVWMPQKSTEGPGVSV